MTAPQFTTNAFSVAPVSILYRVEKPSRKPASVTVTRTQREPLYECDCAMFTLYGDCEHAEAVRSERQRQGRQ
jgi:hypothetical protein